MRPPVKQTPRSVGSQTLEARGPDGLVPDEEARRIYFGE
jgi:hypothetical protein